MPTTASMKAPSPLCLRALRSLAFPPPAPHTRRIQPQQRCYATNSPPPPRPRSFKAPSPPPEPETLDPTQPSSSSSSSPSPSKPPPPRPLFRPTPSGPDLRKKRDDAEDFTPYPLTRPIGLPQPPDPYDNTGTDKRTLRQRRDDFHSYENHLAKRARMTKQIAKPYFRDWSNMRFFKGKVFGAPERVFRAEWALWFPNFFGRSLLKKAKGGSGDRGVERRMERAGDGYSGYGRGTTEVMGGKVSVVSVVGNEWAQRQVDTFTSKKENPELHALLSAHGDVAQRVEINWEGNVLKWWLLQLFAVPGLRRSRTVEEQGRYFMVRRGVSEVMREAIGMLNEKCGYVYLVDGECKIRWAGSAEASEEERRSLVEGLKRLVKEARTPRESVRESPEERKERLEAAVMDVVDEDGAAAEKKAAAAGG